MDARKDEIEFFKKQGVYEKILRTVSYERTGRAPVKVRWVDVNKGDEQHPDYRSRLVAMEFKTDSNAEWFSGTPPLKALRFLWVLFITLVYIYPPDIHCGFSGSLITYRSQDFLIRSL